MTLGQKIKRRREFLGYSQKTLSEASGVGQSYISQLENGIYQPTAPVISRLAKSLGCTADYLIGNDSEESERRKAV